VLWAPRGCNLRAQLVARDLLLAVVGGSDADSLAPIGQAYTLFLGTSTSDLYRAIQRGDVCCDGGYWSLSQHIDVSRRWLRQRSLHGQVRLALDGAGITQRKRIESPEKGLRSSQPIECQRSAASRWPIEEINYSAIQTALRSGCCMAHEIS